MWLLGRLVAAPCTRREEYDLIFKSGDDVRQDLLVMQLLGLCDRVLKESPARLDLCFTLYKVLPTAVDEGLVECVGDSAALECAVGRCGRWSRRSGRSRSSRRAWRTR